VGKDAVLKRVGTASGTLFFGFADYKVTPNIDPPDQTDGWEYQKYDTIPPRGTGWKFNWGATDGVVAFPAWFAALFLSSLATAPWIRRSWRCSLRALLIAMTLFAVAVGLITWLFK
jgi:hypothetical protein